MEMSMIPVGLATAEFVVLMGNEFPFDKKLWKKAKELIGQSPKALFLRRYAQPCGRPNWRLALAWRVSERAEARYNAPHRRLQSAAPRERRAGQSVTNAF
jgi:hypothetical protein